MYIRTCSTVRAGIVEHAFARSRACHYRILDVHWPPLPWRQLADWLTRITSELRSRSRPCFRRRSGTSRLGLFPVYIELWFVLLPSNLGEMFPAVGYGSNDSRLQMSRTLLNCKDDVEELTNTCHASGDRIDSSRSLPAFVIPRIVNPRRAVERLVSDRLFPVQLTSRGHTFYQTGLHKRIPGSV